MQESNVVPIENNDLYKGLNCSLKQSKFVNFYYDPIYKFPIVPPPGSYSLPLSTCYFPDSAKPSEFYSYLHGASPFKTCATPQKPSKFLEKPLQKAPKNSLQVSINSSLSLASFQKPFNLAEEIQNKGESLMNSSLLSLSFSREKELQKKDQLMPFQLESLRFNSVSSINGSQFRDSMVSGNDYLMNFSNLEASGLESENKSRLYQKGEDLTELLSNDEALFTGIKTDESLKRNPCLVELVPEHEEECSWMMYRSAEALKKFNHSSEDEFSSQDDEGPLLINPGRLFLNGETASKAKLSGNLPTPGAIQKITQKSLTDSSDNFLSTVPETQILTENPDIFSPILKKLVILHWTKNSSKIIEAIPTSGFFAALSIEFSSEESQGKVFPGGRDQGKNPWFGLLSRNPVDLICKCAPIQWISCGFEHMAIVTLSGQVFTWGYGGSGSLGHGTTQSTMLPRMVEGLIPQKIVYLECGGYHNAAVSEEGEVWVWGRGDVNQLGIDIFKLSKDEIGVLALVPMVIEEFIDQRVNIKAVACGEAHTLMLDSEGKVYSCGWGEDGQLGLGEYDTQGSFLDKNINCITSLPAKIVKISAGSTFSACLSDLGKVYTWGNGEQGQLGQGIYLKSAKVPTYVNSLSQDFIIDLVCGESHTMCISQNGKVFGWGQGTAGIFNDQHLYPIGTDIICFATRVIPIVKTSQEFLIAK